MKFFSMSFWVFFMCQSLFGQAKLATKITNVDTLKTIIVYSINNKTNEIIAKIQIKARLDIK